MSSCSGLPVSGDEPKLIPWVCGAPEINRRALGARSRTWWATCSHGAGSRPQSAPGQPRQSPAGPGRRAGLLDTSHPAEDTTSCRPGTGDPRPLSRGRTRATSTDARSPAPPRPQRQPATHLPHLRASDPEPATARARKAARPGAAASQPAAAPGGPSARTPRTLG